MVMTMAFRSDELWRDIPGYDGIYEVSNLGYVRTKEGKYTYTDWHGKRIWKQRYIKQRLNEDRKGRIDARVTLYKNGKPTSWLVSRLVGMAWVDGYQEDLTINHIDGNSLNNRCSNLEWISVKENIQKAFDMGLYKNVQKPVILRRNGQEYRFSSMADASRFCGRNKNYVSQCFYRHRKASSVDGKAYFIEVIECV